ncbi:DUF4129 domain-containing protein [Mucilaginibacter pedocola]|uniref:Protein-glutamine gamma-glutamyltransferase-like C-terminal domain-containing protein n=1 Tax=Mucilaginibacter pedocola TaxID=1792845 RepID=A0A1S9PBW9_9SPHI|nr:DUF4129 domain-containing protein [Mucilaginibacter pedocola]OOQ58473.1 hypothetical protein BC343_07320 [Mucilaginibacter pedocola]
MLRITCLFIFLLFARAGFAAADTTAVPVKKGVKADTAKIVKVPAVVKADTSAVSIRRFNDAAIKKYAAQPEFKYNEVKTGGLSWWTRFWIWFWAWFQSLFSKNKTEISGFAVFMKYFFIMTGVAALVFLILKLSGINMLQLFRKKPYSAISYSEAVENIHEIDFEAEIENAVAVKNYRLAVRLLYLRSLKQLSDAGLINWQINKTNTTYVTELTDATQREAFRRLTLQFEYVWYGDFVINGDIFKKINTLFSNFKSKAE